MFEDLLKDLDKQLSLHGVSEGKKVSFALESPSQIITKPGKGILKNTENPNYNLEIKSPTVEYSSSLSGSDEEDDSEDVDLSLTEEEKYVQKIPMDFTIPDGSDSDDSADLVKDSVKVYIENTSTFSIFKVQAQMQGKEVIAKIIEENSLQKDGWALFEVNRDLGVERPIRDWENILGIMNTWDINTTNYLLLKKYAYGVTVGVGAITGKYPKAQGFLYLELERGKWRKRFCFLKKWDLFYLEDSKDPGSAKFFVSTKDYDVYSLSQKKRKMPTEFALALRACRNPSLLNNAQEYCKFVCVEKQKSHFDWILSLRLNRSEVMFEDDLDFFRRFKEIPEKAWIRKTETSENAEYFYSSRTLSPDTVEPSAEYMEESSKEDKETLFSQLERHGSINSVGSGGSVNGTDGQSNGSRKVKTLLSFESGDYRTNPRHRVIKEGDALRKHGASGRSKLLIDVSDSNLCQTCGCSEFRRVFTGRREAQCGNCLHVHNNI